MTFGGGGGSAGRRNSGGVPRLARTLTREQVTQLCDVMIIEGIGKAVPLEGVALPHARGRLEGTQIDVPAQEGPLLITHWDRDDGSFHHTVRQAYLMAAADVAVDRDIVDHMHVIAALRHEAGRPASSSR